MQSETVYYRNGLSVVKMYVSATEQEWRDDPEAFVRWVVDQKTTRWAANSWRVFRASLRFFLTENGAPIEAIDLLSTLSQDIPPKQRVATSTNKKRFLMADALKIEAALADPKSCRLTGGVYDKMLSMFIMANIKIGLRPTEWDKASLVYVDGNPAVMVVNAKTSQGRGNGYARLLRVNQETADLVLRAMSEKDHLASMGAEWNRVQHAMSVRIITVRDAVGIDGVTLYSTRHQFSADAKSVGRSQREVADMMGHASEATAGMHYGKKRVGTGNSIVFDAKGVTLEEFTKLIELSSIKYGDTKKEMVTIDHS